MRQETRSALFQHWPFLTRQEADLRKAAVEVEEKKRLEQRMLLGLDRIDLAMPRHDASLCALPPLPSSSSESMQDESAELRPFRGKEVAFPGQGGVSGVCSLLQGAVAEASSTEHRRLVFPPIMVGFRTSAGRVGRRVGRRGGRVSLPFSLVPQA